MTWTIDPAHSEINFTVRHMMISNVRGQFENFSGTVEFDEVNRANSTVDVQIEAASINTNDPKRDGHLRSPDFLDADNFPFLTFRSTRVELINNDNAKIYGDLTIRGETRPIVLDAEYNGKVKSPWGSNSAGFSASGKINRNDWGLNWNVALETGGWLVADEIKIFLEMELIEVHEHELATA